MDEQFPQANSALYVNGLVLPGEADEHEKELRVSIQGCHVGGTVAY